MKDDNTTEEEVVPDEESPSPKVLRRSSCRTVTPAPEYRHVVVHPDGSLHWEPVEPVES